MQLSDVLTKFLSDVYLSAAWGSLWLNINEGKPGQYLLVLLGNGKHSSGNLVAEISLPILCFPCHLCNKFSDEFQRTGFNCGSLGFDERVSVFIKDMRLDCDPTFSTEVTQWS